jgi:hypothetical protein
MPRNRKPKPPADPVDARIRVYGLGEDVKAHEARCGRCGYYLVLFEWSRMPIGDMWSPLFVPIDNGDRVMASVWGRSWDGGVWRATGERARQRREALSALERGLGHEGDIHRERLRMGAFYRRNRGDRIQKTMSIGLHPPVAGEGFHLPTRMECERCYVENTIGLNAPAA